MWYPKIFSYALETEPLVKEQERENIDKQRIYILLFTLLENLIWTSQYRVMDSASLMGGV
jgi:hypothetical protein